MCNSSDLVVIVRLSWKLEIELGKSLIGETMSIILDGGLLT